MPLEELLVDRILWGECYMISSIPWFQWQTYMLRILRLLLPAQISSKLPTYKATCHFMEEFVDFSKILQI